MAEDDVERLKEEIKKLRREVDSYKRAIRELGIQIETLQKSERAHIARNPWKTRVGPLRTGGFSAPGEEEY